MILINIYFFILNIFSFSFALLIAVILICILHLLLLCLTILLLFIALVESAIGVYIIFVFFGNISSIFRGSFIMLSLPQVYAFLLHFSVVFLHQNFSGFQQLMCICHRCMSVFNVKILNICINFYRGFCFEINGVFLLNINKLH